MKPLPALLITLLALTHSATASDLRQVFLNPPEEAKPRGYWVWPNGNFDYAAIRHELAEFKAKGLGGVDIFDLGIRNTKGSIPPGPGFMSVEQVDGIAFALAEAKRHGLKLGLIVSSSWNAGSTWTPPEFASMNLVAWRDEVTGPLRYERVLPFPELPEFFQKPYGKFPLHVPKDEQGRPIYRKDVAVLAYPLDAEGRIADPKQVRLLNDRVDAAGSSRPASACCWIWTRWARWRGSISTAAKPACRASPRTPWTSPTSSAPARTRFPRQMTVDLRLPKASPNAP